MSKTGYHYTSWRNWELIQKYGMKTYPILKDELLEFFDGFPKGIWVWEYDLEPQSELGVIVAQLGNKGSTKIVKLTVNYNEDDILHYENNFGRGKVRLVHSGTIGNWQYHKESPEAVIITKPIDIENIKLIKTFDLMDVVRESSNVKS